MANILAIDDEKAVLALIKNILQKDGNVVTAVRNPNEVLQMQLGKFDLILLDVMMPGIDGFSLCRKIRSKVELIKLIDSTSIFFIDLRMIYKTPVREIPNGRKMAETGLTVLTPHSIFFFIASFFA